MGPPHNAHAVPQRQHFQQEGNAGLLPPRVVANPHHGQRQRHQFGQLQGRHGLPRHAKDNHFDGDLRHGQAKGQTEPPALARQDDGIDRKRRQNEHGRRKEFGQGRKALRGGPLLGQDAHEGQAAEGGDHGVPAQEEQMVELNLTSDLHNTIARKAPQNLPGRTTAQRLHDRFRQHPHCSTVKLRPLPRPADKGDRVGERRERQSVIDFGDTQVLSRRVRQHARVVLFPLRLEKAKLQDRLGGPEPVRVVVVTIGAAVRSRTRQRHPRHDRAEVLQQAEAVDAVVEELSEGTAGARSSRLFAVHAVQRVVDRTTVGVEQQDPVGDGAAAAAIIIGIGRGSSSIHEIVWQVVPRDQVRHDAVQSPERGDHVGCHAQGQKIRQRLPRGIEQGVQHRVGARRVLVKGDLRDAVLRQDTLGSGRLEAPPVLLVVCERLRVPHVVRSGGVFGNGRELVKVAVDHCV